ncbi:hypothetical protein H4N54_00850 [Limnospira fusiformis KN01]|uniref:hypothetical protein n=1 Tax=Limnospira fusiformis TaxID=54297 RepID=UPI0016589388|nr:hypothetical protein [Limnospira fusiformis]ULB45984.1 hypothetical protein H4N54_00850 [Limnospira fusiformis KN01]
MKNLENEIYLGGLLDIAASIEDYAERINVRLDGFSREKPEHLAEVIGYLQLIKDLTTQGLKEAKKL